jgi:hypothetical protein
MRAEPFDRLRTALVAARWRQQLYISWPVDTPDLPQRIADFTNSGSLPKRFLQRVQHVAGAAGHRPNFDQGGVNSSLITIGA